MTFITDINPATPAGSEPVSQGDDQIRQFKSDVRDTFPEMDGAFTGDAQSMQTSIPDTTPAEALASVTVVNRGYLPGNILRYHDEALTPGNYSVAIQSALDQQFEGGEAVIIPEGTYPFDTTLQFRSGNTIYGRSQQLTLLQYSGAAQAFLNGDLSTDSFGNVFTGFTLEPTGGASHGIYMQRCKNGRLTNLLIRNFPKNVVIYGAGASTGQSLYNILFGCQINGATNIGLEIGGGPGGQSINANKVIACTLLNNKQAVRIETSNENHIFQCQIENQSGDQTAVTSGIEITSGETGKTGDNCIQENRFEFHPGHAISINANVANTRMQQNLWFDTGGTIDDQSDSTVWDDRNQFRGQGYVRRVALINGSTAPCHTFTREGNGGDGTHAAMEVLDTSSVASTSPVTLKLKSERTNQDLAARQFGRALQVIDRDSAPGGAVETFGVRGDGAIMSNQLVSNNLTEQDWAGYLPIYDPADGNAIIGYIPYRTSW